MEDGTISEDQQLDNIQHQIKDALARGDLDSALNHLSKLFLYRFNEKKDTNQFWVDLVTGLELIRERMKAENSSKERFKINIENIIKLSQLIIESHFYPQHEEVIISNDIHRDLVTNTRTEDPNYISQLLRLSLRLENTNTIFLSGGIGVGKTTLAKIIHNIRFRKSYFDITKLEEKFVSQNLGGLSNELASSELFGHLKGSFTGALKDKTGIVKLAEGGTLFLDEIDKTSVGVRHMLLTFIEDGEYRRVGDEKLRKIENPFIIFASNRDLETLVDDGQFEEDFLSRMRACRIYIPPIDKRKKDKQKMAEFYLSQLNDDSKNIVRLESTALYDIKNLPFPDNLRGLRNLIKNCYHEAVHKDSIISSEIVANAYSALYHTEFKRQINTFERELTPLFNYWKNKQSDKNFLDGCISPILAKWFINQHPDLCKNKKAIFKILGISGEKGSREKSPLDDYNDTYDSLLVS